MTPAKLPQPALPQPWFPSCFTWEPVLDPLGNQKQSLRRRQGSDEIFGVAWAGDPTEDVIPHARWLFSYVLIAQLVIPFFRIPYRLACLVVGDFVQPGLNNAENAWLLRLQAWSKDPTSLKPSRAQQVMLQVVHVTAEAFKNIAKIGLYAVVGCPFGPLWWIALYGALLNPLDAGLIYSRVEGWTARDQMPLVSDACTKRIEACLRIGNFKFFQALGGDYLLPCQQPDQVGLSHSMLRVNRFDECLQKDSFHSMRLELAESRTFFKREGIDVVAQLKDFRQWNSLIKLLDVNGDKADEQMEDIDTLLYAIKKHYLKEPQNLAVLKQELQTACSNLCALIHNRRCGIVKQINEFLGKRAQGLALPESLFYPILNWEDRRFSEQDLNDLKDLRSRLENLRLPEPLKPESDSLARPC